MFVENGKVAVVVFNFVSMDIKGLSWFFFFLGKRVNMTKCHC